MGIVGHSIRDLGMGWNGMVWKVSGKGGLGGVVWCGGGLVGRVAVCGTGGREFESLFGLWTVSGGIKAEWGDWLYRVGGIADTMPPTL